MNIATTHEQTRDLLGAKALDALDPQDLALVDEHLRSCPLCCSELGEYTDAAGLLARSAPLTPMPPLNSERMRARLLARAAADARPGSDGESAEGVSGVLRLQRPGNSGFWIRWSGWAVAAGLSSLLLSHHAFHRPLDLGWLAAAALSLVVVVLGGYVVRMRERAADKGRRNQRLERSS